MRIVTQYSHLNGYEHILVHKPQVWTDIMDVIGAIDTDTCWTKLSKEKTKQGRMLLSPQEINKRFMGEFSKRDWRESRTS